MAKRGSTENRDVARPRCILKSWTHRVSTGFLRCKCPMPRLAMKQCKKSGFAARDAGNSRKDDEWRKIIAEQVGKGPSRYYTVTKSQKLRWLAGFWMVLWPVVTGGFWCDAKMEVVESPSSAVILAASPNHLGLDERNLVT